MPRSPSGGSPGPSPSPWPMARWAVLGCLATACAVLLASEMGTSSPQPPSFSPQPPSSPLPVNFSSEALSSCRWVDRGESQHYGCSMCTPGGCPANETSSELHLRRPTDTVAFVGDSIARQLYLIARCTLRPWSDRWPSFVFMPVVTHTRHLVQSLRRILSSADTVVFHFGMWYNWDPSNPQPEPPSGVTANYTLEVFNKCMGVTGFPTALARGYAAMINCSHPRCLQHPSTPADVDANARWRRECPGALGRLAYKSDLLRFAQTLSAVWTEGTHWRTRRIVWRKSTPQHYGTVSGMFPATEHHSHSWPASNTATCSRIRNKTLARARNDLADSVLGPLIQSGGGPPLMRMSTWGQDVTAYQVHPVRDCTHTCMHSTVTWRWLQKPWCDTCSGSNG